LITFKECEILKILFEFGSLMYHVILTTVPYNWCGFLFSSCIHYKEHQSRHYWYTLISYITALEGNCPHSQNLSLPYIWRPAESSFRRRRRRQLLWSVWKLIDFSFYEVSRAEYVQNFASYLVITTSSLITFGLRYLIIIKV
jgi:hypothetical protein